MCLMENQDLFICIDHVGLAVPDLDEAIKFHTEVLGWRELHREVNEEQGVAEAMIGTGDQGEENGKIQLLAPLNEDSTIAKWLGRNGGPGIQQLAYRVHDIDHVCAVLRERGLRLLYPEPKRGTANSRINFVHPKDAGGVLLELVEPAKDASH
ncbi:MAG: methylmalonyl-CoA epimerase [Propionibacteriaceae bacterium]|nr:methylmalonyl-CoA epimerase [Propionibacteriaceae bacterium]